MKNQSRKGEGFPGQRMILLPKLIEQKCQTMPLVNTLFITNMGCFPKAQHHYFQRPNGISQAIVLYCTGGKGWVQVRKQRLDVRGGDVVILPPDTAHSYGADPDNPWTIYWFHLKGMDSAQVPLTVFGEPGRIVCQIGVSDERIALFDAVYDTFSDGYSRGNVLYANLTLHYFLASCAVPHRFQKTPVSGPNPVATAVAFMRANLSIPLKLETIADSCHLSVSYFSGLFKKETGYSPIDYFNLLRIQKSCQLLSFSTLRINEIAQHIGIEDPYYFSRLFKKQMGISPLDYRKSVEVKIRGQPTTD